MRERTKLALILAVILTARVLGFELGIARAVGAIAFSVVIGLFMHLIYRKEEDALAANSPVVLPDDASKRSLAQDSIYFAAMIGILVFANWSRPGASETGIWPLVYSVKWIVTGALGLLLVVFLVKWFNKDELLEWTDSSWIFAKQILPLLLIGVFVAGFLLGGPGGGVGVIPNEWIGSMVGGNSLGANLFASVAGAFMYFATLTEVPSW